MRCSFARALLLTCVSGVTSVVARDPVQLFVLSVPHPPSGGLEANLWTSSGGSWSATNFVVSGKQPSATNPLGNPSFNATIANEGGPNYSRYLAVKYNSTLTMLYALALAGATIDNQVLSGPVNAYIDQVNKVFIPNYASQKGQMWNSSSAIFIVSMGNNDVYDGYNYANTDGLVNNLMQSYWNSATETLYQAGARKFLFVSTPSQEKSQKVLSKGATAVTKFKELKWKFNDALFAKRDQFKANHTDVQARFFNSSSFLNPILKNPTAYGFNKNASCQNDVDGANAGCVWQNSFHVNYRVHDLMASAMVEDLAALGF